MIDAGFDEKSYLAKYADVREAVKAGAFASGYAHYVAFGIAEGRQGKTIAQSRKALDVTPAISAAAEQLGARFKAAPAIPESDHILAYIINHSARSATEGPQGGVAQYFEKGKEDAVQVEDVIRRLGLRRDHAILEFAAGFGRVTRHLTHLNLTASDIHDQALYFLERDIGVKAIPSAISPELMPPAPLQFDFVFVLSLFSHLPDKLFGPWLSRLSEMLTPGGFLMFTTHGEAAGEKSKALLDALDSEAGFGYLPYSDQADLGEDIYGSSIATHSGSSSSFHEDTRSLVYIRRMVGFTGSMDSAIYPNRRSITAVLSTSLSGIIHKICASFTHVQACAFSHIQVLRSPESNPVVQVQPKSLFAREQSSTEHGTSTGRPGL
jgi:SAM-dependent methyltransferase